LAAGCGSSGGGSEVSKPSATPLTPSAQLVQYLDRIEPRQKELDRLRQNVLAAVERVHPGRPDRTWTVAATRLATVTAGLDRLSVAVVGVKPPARLKTAHQDLAESIAVLETYVYDVKTALDARIPSLLASAATADSTRMAVLRGTWEAAVTDYARRLGVTLPSWLGGPSLSA
jgi:hypothetical protein